MLWGRGYFLHQFPKTKSLIEPFENGHLIMVNGIMVFFWTKTERHIVVMMWVMMVI